MTPEDRETLRHMLQRAEYGASANSPFDLTRARHAREADVLRAALVERTCGTCRHLLEQADHDDSAFKCRIHNSWRTKDDGCLKGWEPKEER